MLVLRLKLEFCAPGEHVIRAGDLGSKMYFVADGVLEVQTGQGPEKDVLRPASRTSKCETMSLCGSNLGELLEEPQVSQRCDGIHFTNRRWSRAESRWALAWFLVISMRAMSLSLLASGCRILQRLTTGNYFGVTTCINRNKCPISVVSIGHCELFSLSREDLMECASVWPDLSADLTNAGVPLSFPVCSGQIITTFVCRTFYSHIHNACLELAQHCLLHSTEQNRVN